MRLQRLAVLAAVLAGVTVAFAAGEPVALKTTEIGTGPTIVFVTDVGTARSSWMPVARRLVARHRVVLVDLPGHGGAECPTSRSKPRPRTRRRVHARQPKDSTIVVGRGVGGLLASRLPGAHPERARPGADRHATAPSKQIPINLAQTVLPNGSTRTTTSSSR
jgi:pimeloyl-ACP methyl ester carboxylesterase